MRLWLCVWLLALASGPRAFAQAAPAACASAGTPRVDGAFVLGAEDASLLPKLIDHLRAALAARDIAFCPGERDPASTASLVLHIERTVDGRVEASIEVSDVLTQKRVARTLDLTRLPKDGWALSLAASSDELLRASWAELTMRDAPVPKTPAPVEVVRAVQVIAPAPALRRVELAPEANAVWLRHRTAFGAKLRLHYWFDAHWALLTSAGASFGLRVRAEHGSVRADTQDLELGAAYAWPSARAPLGLAVELTGAVSRLAFAARPGAQGAAGSFADWSIGSALRVRGFWGAGPFRLSAALGLVYALRPVAARDEGKVVTSNRGIGGEAVLAAGAFF